jgi:Ca-activated chloride channel family protein
MVKRFSFEMGVDLDLVAREVPSQRILELVITPPAARKAAVRPALNLAVVIDRSGSMSGDKLEYVKKAAAHVIDLLQEQDRVAIVAFDTEVVLVSPSVPVTQSMRLELKKSIKRIESGSSTNLSGGWLTGCQEVAGVAQEGGLYRVLLLTDGLANAGITDLEELGVHAGQLLVRGVATSTFGVGEGFDEHLLEHMANQGGGRFYYIDHPQSIPSIFEGEFKELAAITARNVEIFVDIPAGVAAQVMGGWRAENENNKLHLWLGDIAATQRREVYIKLLTPPVGNQPQISIHARASGQGENKKQFDVEAELILKYAPEVEVKAAPLRSDVMQRYSLVEIADKATEALKLERAGEGKKASQMLSMSGMAAAPYIAEESREEYMNLSKRMSRGLDEKDRKNSHQTSYNQKQLRRKI